jgi:hypothetical protein
MTLLRHKELEIPKGNPFQYCKLHRQQYGEILTDIVGTYADGFVLALDNKWGTGKTTFIKMWQQHLKENKFNTIYFNAWEHDFDNKPLAAILGELRAIENPNEPVSFQQLTQAAAALLKGITPLLLKGLAKYLGGGPIAQEIIETASTSYKDILTEEIDDYLERKKGLEKFKMALENYVSDNCGENPLIFIIDELDRCRPDYAVQVLEQVKHFFSVPGIIFVLAIDKQQLGNAIKGFYGTDLIDSNEYLRRFIDVEFTLPQPEVKEYCSYLFEYYVIDELFRKRATARGTHSTVEFDRFTRNAATFLNASGLSLRQIEKIAINLRIFLARTEVYDEIGLELLVFLIHCRLHHKQFFYSLMDRKISIEQFEEHFLKTIPAERSPAENSIYGEILAGLLALNASLFTQDPSTVLLIFQNGTIPTSKIQPKMGIDTGYFGKIIHDFISANFDILRDGQVFLDKIDKFGKMNV